MRAPRLQMTSVAVYWAVHAGCLGVLFTGITLRAMAILAVTYTIRFLGISLGYHRYFAHRSFRTSRFVQFLVGVWATLGFQRGILWWAQTHRHHHRHADTEEDLHSPEHQGFWYSHWMWGFETRNMQTDHQQVKDLAAFPELVWLDSETAINLIAAAYIALLALLFGWQGVIWGFFCSTVACWQMVHWIQSFSHSKGGYRRFPSADRSRNHWLIGVLSFGEYHNNHHHFPWSARESWAWWELDIGYWILKAGESLGLVWDVKSARKTGVRTAARHSVARAAAVEE